MPNIGYFHPQIVHFVIVLLAVGVIARLVSLTGRWQFSDPMASWLLLSGTVAAVLAVATGDKAHGPVERVPGAREAVQEHEEWGERARNVFFVVAGIELAALALRRRKARRWLLVASGVAGLAGYAVVYEAAERGGELVYGYAGGVGIRSGDTSDVTRLLTAGLYHQAQQDRVAGRSAAAARLIEELGRRHPDDAMVQLLAVESLLQDRKDGTAALAALALLPVPADQPRIAVRHGLLLVDAYTFAGRADSARAVLQRLAAQFPESRALQERMRR